MACSCCGKCGCQCGTLPYTMTVLFSGLTTKTAGNYCDLSFESKYGGGAAGVATAPGGCDGDEDAACRHIGSSCKDGEATFDPSNRGPLAGVLLTEAGSCYAKLGRVAPKLTASASPGQGATFNVQASQKKDDLGIDYWEVGSISVSGGTDYVDGSTVTISRAVEDTMEEAASATLAAEPIVTDPDTGKTSGGKPISVTVQNRGKYYREDADEPPYVAQITVTPCGGGQGAEIKATVDSDTKSKTFGQITGLTIEEPGENYLAWRWTKTCHDYANGLSLVLRADNPKPLVAACAKSCFGSGATANIVALGERVEPTIKLSGTGTKGDFSVTLSSDIEDENEYLNYWTISSVVASGGVDYLSGPATISAPCATVGEDAIVELTATEIVVDPETGKKSGGVLTGATVERGGKYYIQRDYDGGLTPIKYVTLGSAGSGYALLGREQPAITLEADPLPGGEKASFTPTLASKQDDCGRDYWYVSKVSSSGGFGYSTGQALEVTTSDTKQLAASLSIVTKENVEGQPPGQIDSVTIHEGGKYYRENESIPPYVAKVEFVVDQDVLSTGKDATITGVVNSNPKSPDFGKVTRVKIENHGSGYTLFGGSASCTYSGGCGSTCGIHPPYANLEFRGTDKEPEITLGDRTFRMTDKVADCRSLPTEATVLHSSSGGSVKLSPRGLWNPTAPRCGGCDGCQSPDCHGPCQCAGDCGPGCGCREGRCAACCGSCGEGKPCPDGCECVDGECVPPCPPSCAGLQISSAILFGVDTPPEDFAEKSKTSGSYSGADFDPDGRHWLSEWTIEKVSDERWTANFHAKLDVRYELAPDYVHDVVYKRRPGCGEWYLASFRRRVTAGDWVQEGEELGSQGTCYCETFLSFDPDEGENSFESDCSPPPPDQFGQVHPCPSFDVYGTPAEDWTYGFWHPFGLYGCPEENPLP